MARLTALLELLNGRRLRLPFAFELPAFSRLRLPPLALAWALLVLAAATTVVTLANLGPLSGDGEPLAIAAIPIPEAQAPVAPPQAQLPLPVVPAGPLPAWQANARPFPPADPRPRLAVIVGGLGLSVEATEAAIRLPGEYTLGFLAYGRNVAHWMKLARAAGHEVLLDAPMEPARYPIDDPGPSPLLAALPPAENIKRLEAALTMAENAVGVANHMGARYLGAPQQVQALLAALSERGLMFVGQGEAAKAAVAAGGRGQPVVASDLLTDGGAFGREVLMARLAVAVERARRDKAASVTVEPFPYVLEALQSLHGRLAQEGVALAPVTAIWARTRSVEGASLPRP